MLLNQSALQHMIRPQDLPLMLETMEVYQAVNDSTPERIAIARFWDDNPNVSHHVGHMMYSTEKPFSCRTLDGALLQRQFV